MHVKPEDTVAGRTSVMGNILKKNLKRRMTEIFFFTNGDDFSV